MQLREKILVIAPHPDDEVIGCGGFLLRQHQQGASSSVVYLTSGGAGSSSIKPEELVGVREDEAKKGAHILGIEELLFLREVDGSLSMREDLALRLSEIILETKPTAVLVPHENDNHPDHKVAHQLVLEAVNLTEEKYRVPEILAYEVWTPLQQVDFVVDCTSVVEDKLRALREHRSQLAEVDYDDGTEALNRYRGAFTQRGKYAECYQMIRVADGMIDPETETPL